MYIKDSFTYSLNDNPVLECADIEVAVERVVDRVMRTTARTILRDLIRNCDLYLLFATILPGKVRAQW